MSSLKLSAILLVLLQLLPITSVLSQDGAEPVQSGKEQQKTIDFVAYNAQGQPLQGLRKNELRLWENGQEREIKQLLEISHNEDASISYSSALGLSRKYVLLWDFQSLTNAQLKASLELSRVLINDYLGEKDTVMLVSVMDNLQVIQSFTSDKNLLLCAVNELDNRENRRNQFELKQTNTPDDTITTAKIKNSLRFAANLKVLASLLDDIDDRKNLLLFSNGPGLDPRETANQTLNEKVEEAVTELNSANIVLNFLNLDVKLTRKHGLDYKEDEITSSLGVNNSMLQAHSRMFLKRLAADTLGASYQTSDFRNYSQLVANILDAGSSYYILTFVPGDPEDLKSPLRSIKLSLNSGEGRLKFRRSYYYKRAFSQFSEEQKNKHLTEGFDTGSQIDELHVESSFFFNRCAEDKMKVFFTAQCPGENLKVGPDGSYSVELLLASVRMDGTVISSVNKEFSFSFAGENKPGVFRLVESLNCEPGVNNIKVALRDNTSGKRSYFYKNIMFRFPPSDSLLLLPPLFYRSLPADEAAILDLKEEIKQAWTQNYSIEDSELLPEKNGVVLACLKREFKQGETVRFLSRVNNPVTGPFKRENYRVVFAVSPRSSNRKKSRVLKRILPSDLSLELSGDHVVIKGAFSSKDCEPGHHDLFVVVLEKNTGRQNTSFAPFSVVN